MSTPPDQKPRATLPAPRRDSSVGGVIGAFESETAGVILKTSPEREHVLLYALCAGLFLCLLLSAVVKLDRVVVGVGKTVPIGGEMYASRQRHRPRGPRALR